MRRRGELTAWGPPTDVEDHAWLERDGMIVDKTSDQFEDLSEKVCVTPDSSAWHDSFDIPGEIERQPGDFRGSKNERESECLNRAYCAILGEIT